MSEKSIRWFCPICNDFVGIRKTEELREAVLQAKLIPLPIIVKHGDPPHYSILQLDRDLRDRGRLNTTFYFDLTEITPKKTTEVDMNLKEKLEHITEELSGIQRKIWAILDE
jgi:hypothetical protein